MSRGRLADRRRKPADLDAVAVLVAPAHARSIENGSHPPMVEWASRPLVSRLQLHKPLDVVDRCQQGVDLRLDRGAELRRSLIGTPQADMHPERT